MIEGKVKTLFEDKEHEQAIFPRTKTSAISDENNVGLDVIIDELKKSVSNGKTLVADAITEKGISTASDATFGTMATNINSIKVASGNAAASDVLVGKTFSNASGNGTGTMTDRTKVDSSIGSFNSSYPDLSLHKGINLQATVPTVDGNKWVTMCPPEGYYAGSGRAYVGVPASDFGNATATNVLSGKTFTSSAGLIVAGTMPAHGAYNFSVTPSKSAQSITIPAGYYNGSGKINVSAIPASITQKTTMMKLFWNKVVNYSAGYVEIGYTVPIKPTSIYVYVVQNNADSGTWGWDMIIQGRRKGTNTWDNLCVRSQDVPGDDSRTVSETFSISTSYYYDAFRGYSRDMGRLGGNAHITVTGVVDINQI